MWEAPFFKGIEIIIIAQLWRKTHPHLILTSQRKFSVCFLSSWNEYMREKFVEISDNLE